MPMPKEFFITSSLSTSPKAAHSAHEIFFCRILLVHIVCIEKKLYLLDLKFEYYTEKDGAILAKYFNYFKSILAFTIYYVPALPPT